MIGIQWVLLKSHCTLLQDKINKGRFLSHLRVHEKVDNYYVTQKSIHIFILEFQIYSL